MRTTLFVCSSILLASVACGGGGGTPEGAATPTAATANATPGDSTLPKPADHPESDKVTWKKDAKSCHPSTAVTGDLTAAATGIANTCMAGGATKLHQVGSPTNGQGGPGAMVQSIPLKAQANHCYRIFGIAEATVKDFDIAVMDSAGKSAGEDLTDSNDAIVLEDGEICFKADDDVNVNAAVAAGSGKWSVEIWSD